LRFTTEIKIRGYHLDVYGHVNNARWLELLEEARWRWLDESVDLAAWDAAGLGIAVLSVAIRYRRPARVHDLVAIRCWMTHVGGKTGVCQQEAVLAATGEQLVAAEVRFVLFDRATGRSRAFDAAARDHFERYLEPEARA